MCGIAGYFIPHSFVDQPDMAITMARCIRHRGPDDEGFVFINTDTASTLSCSGRESDATIRSRLPCVDNFSHGYSHNLAMSHRRYSIIDLSPAGHQPMWDGEGEICITFNGEIYNYLELRMELIRNGHRFETQSDTEVILRGYRQWGTEVFRRLNGPWAITLYDKRINRFLLSRDRLGKAPLYYAVNKSRFFWSSEIKSILSACGSGSFRIREQAIDDYLVFGWRDLDGTFWSGIEDFPPASIAWINPDLSLDCESFWSLPSSRRTTADVSPAEATSRLKSLLVDAINIRRRADVPVAFELSGGMDSSSLVALAASHLDNVISAYTIKFPEKHSDEEPFAKHVANLYKQKINYQVITPRKDEFWEGADNFISVEEEPFHSPNLYTNQVLRRHIRNDGFKVVIAGSAGDEVFAGYAGEYLCLFLSYLWRNKKKKMAVRELLHNTEFSPFITSLLLIKNAFIAENRVYEIITRNITKDFYLKPSDILRRKNKSEDILQRMKDNMTNWMMNYWLRSGNKSNFGIPIEPRVPFLDYRVVDFVFSLPLEYLIHDGWHKWILRKTTEDILPFEITWRKRKMGFPFPYREWLYQSKNVVSLNIKNVECPYVDNHELLGQYDKLAKKYPVLLWRFICLSLWWKRFVLQQSIRT